MSQKNLWPLQVIDNPGAQDLSDIDDCINQYNADQTGIDDARYLSIFLRSHDGGLYAALHGHSWGGCCEIKQLWIAEKYRGRGLGSTLLLSAEQEALNRGCRLILLSTHSFQAPRFYRRHGFSTVAAIEGYPAGHSEIVMVKYLTGGR